MNTHRKILAAAALALSLAACRPTPPLDRPVNCIPTRIVPVTGDTYKRVPNTELPMGVWKHANGKIFGYAKWEDSIIYATQAGADGCYPYPNPYLPPEPPLHRTWG